jgi:hypothetical protein
VGYETKKNQKLHLFSLGSMVQNGKFSAAAALFVKTLKNVDFPTFGKPTMPHFSDVPKRPIRGGAFVAPSSFFFGGILLACLTHATTANWTL